MIVNKVLLPLVVLAIFFGGTAPAQNRDSLLEKTHEASASGIDPARQQVVVVTGARFSYRLVEKWIDDYNKINPHVQIIVESRGSSDPVKYDILAEVYEPDEQMRMTREYLNIGRYAILPVATQGSAFADYYGDKGLNRETINRFFFHNIFAGNGKEMASAAKFTVYTRLQKAGVPTVFAKYFGYQQKDIKGTAIAGADSHLLKALLRDSAGVTYLPIPLIYDEGTRKPIEGLAVLPVDLNGNKKVSDEEKFYENVDDVIERLEALEPDEIQNIPIEYLHLSLDRAEASPVAIDFLLWVNQNGQRDLHRFGYLKPEAKRFKPEAFAEFASRRSR